MALTATTPEGLYLVQLLNGMDENCEYAVKVHEDEEPMCSCFGRESSVSSEM